ncbi:DNA topoisomerase IV [beta proteobacterium AAP99]|nr:DNA topoisomerase IV [beta proteobacterium AAP99]
MTDVQTNLFGNDGNGGGGDAVTLGHFAERAYLEYAVSVVKGRALPQVEDGLKPVQRRILYAMDEMGLGPTAKPRKSAAVVGDVLGKLHPHGDQSVYDALVRLAQDFTLRYPLIDGQGNFGSRDGDGAAAMRYTEARLTPIARLLLDEIDQGTVDFIPNYDGTQEEPRLLPARLPMLLLNGASGIAVGMATEVPPHNLKEVAEAAVALIKNESLPDAELMALLPGPDFPGGGQIISSSADIAEAYRTGRGSLKVRSRYEFEELARGQWQLVITQLPHGVSAAKVLSEIEELTNPKVKAGKKSLTPEQQQLKAQMLGVLDAARDESGKEAAVRLVFEPKTSKIDRQELVNTLLAQTSLESNVPLNLVTIGLDGRPRQKALREILVEWGQFRVATVRRRSQHRLAKVDDRIHILEGRQAVLLNIDKVIKIIRAADDPKADLIAAFKLSERQAEDILEIRLRQLAKLEGIKIEQELAELRTEKTELEELLGNESALKRLVIKEIQADAKQYGDARRTLIQAAERASIEVRIEDEPVTVIVSEKGWVRARQGHGHDASLFTFKQGDSLYGAFECSTLDNLVVLGSNGRVYSVPVASLPSARGDGQPITTLIELEAGSKVLHMLAGAADTPLLMATRGGMGFGTKLSDLFTRQRGGKTFLSLDEGDEPLGLIRFARNASAVAVIGGKPGKERLLVFGLDELKTLSAGGKGVILMELDKGEQLLHALPISEAGFVAITDYRNKTHEETFGPRQLAPFIGKRARKGKLLDAKGKGLRVRMLY